MSTKYELVDCWKCQGAGRIDCYACVADGVCFACKGARKIKVSIENEKKAMTPYQVKCAEWIMSATVDQFAKLTFAQLSKARDFAHWIFPAYPALRQTWFDKGEAFFQKLQEERLEQWRSSRTWG